MKRHELWASHYKQLTSINFAIVCEFQNAQFVTFPSISLKHLSAKALSLLLCRARRKSAKLWQRQNSKKVSASACRSTRRFSLSLLAETSARQSPASTSLHAAIFHYNKLFTISSSSPSPSNALRRFSQVSNLWLCLKSKKFINLAIKFHIFRGKSARNSFKKQLWVVNLIIKLSAIRHSTFSRAPTNILNILFRLCQRANIN